MEVLNNNKQKLIPTAGDAYGAAWNIMWKAFAGLLAVSIIYGIISGPPAMFQWQMDDFAWFIFPFALFAIVLGFLFPAPLVTVQSGFILKQSGENPFELKDMFAVFQRNYWNAVAANVVVGLIVGFGFVMLIVPGIIFAIRLAFVPYLVIDREMELTQALNKSWEMTKGYGGQIFLMGIIAFFVVILGLLAFFFGVIISVIWISVAFATMYQAVVEKDRHFQDMITE